MSEMIPTIKGICKRYGNDRARLMDMVREVQDTSDHVQREDFGLIAEEATPSIGGYGTRFVGGIITDRMIRIPAIVLFFLCQRLGRKGRFTDLCGSSHNVG